MPSEVQNTAAAVLIAVIGGRCICEVAGARPETMKSEFAELAVDGAEVAVTAVQGFGYDCTNDFYFEAQLQGPFGEAVKTAKIRIEAADYANGKHLLNVMRGGDYHHIERYNFTCADGKPTLIVEQCDNDMNHKLTSTSFVEKPIDTIFFYREITLNKNILFGRHADVVTMFGDGIDFRVASAGFQDDSATRFVLSSASETCKEVMAAVKADEASLRGDIDNLCVEEACKGRNKDIFHSLGKLLGPLASSTRSARSLGCSEYDEEALRGTLRDKLKRLFVESQEDKALAARNFDAFTARTEEAFQGGADMPRGFVKESVTLLMIGDPSKASVIKDGSGDGAVDERGFEELMKGEATPWDKAFSASLLESNASASSLAMAASSSTRAVDVLGCVPGNQLASCQLTTILLSIAGAVGLIVAIIWLIITFWVLFLSILIAVIVAFVAFFAYLIKCGGHLC